MARYRKHSFGLVGASLAILFTSTTAIAGSGEAGSLSNLDVSLDGTHRIASMQKPYQSAELGVVSESAVRGQPTFARAAQNHPRPDGYERMSDVALAQWYLSRHAAAYHLTASALQTLEVRRVLPLRNGAAIVTFGQRVDGVEVFQQELKVLLGSDKRLVALSGFLHPGAVPGAVIGQTVKGSGWHLTPQSAIAASFLDVHALALSPADLMDTGRRVAMDQFFMLKPSSSLVRQGVTFSRPARVRPVLFAAPEGLVKAWFVELFTDDVALDGPSDFAYVLADRDGELLYRRDLVEDIAFNYRVWAETTGNHRPLNGPLADYSPHPTGLPDGWYPSTVAPVLVSMEGFNEPSDPWLAETATVSTGNNIDAYADLKSADGFTDGDVRAATSGPQAFDYPYDFTATASSSQNQIQGAVTQLFYTTNWLHDWYYDSGFTEKTGNAQKDNLGRGGYQGDIMLAQGMDYSGRNNANMSVPSDGVSPRMQMYIWDGYKESKVTVQPLNLNTIGGTAAFGPTNFNLKGSIVVAKDTAGLSTLCNANATSAAGKVVLADRGSCTFKIKALNAQNAGAIGILIANNTASSAPPGMADDANTTATITIGVQSILQTEGSSIKSALTTAEQTATLYRYTGVEHDGTIDNTVIAHEWGHYLHHRLVPGSSTQLSAQSEGWADFVALHMMVHEEDNIDATYALAVYAGVSITNSGYYGIRRYPYSTDFTKNPLTFKHIQTGTALPTTAPINANSSSNAEVHNAGEVWCNMMWESYASLIRSTYEEGATRSFDDVQRLMGDYMVAGMDLSPNAPTYTESRDALLAAISAMDKADARRVAEAFARRGAGTCAVSPPTTSTDLVGVTESYTLSALLKVGAMTLEEGEETCDQDGVLDAGETGYLSIPILNVGPEAAGVTTLTLSTTLAGASFPDGSTVSVPALGGFASTTVRIPVSLAFSTPDFAALDVKAIIHNDLACVTDQSVNGSFAVNLDDLASVSGIETAESSHEAFKEEVAVGTTAWSRKAVSLYQHTWTGIDYSALGDFRLVSPTLQVSKTSPLIITFEHKYKFETSTDTTTGVTTYWDGSVLEISKDDGATWEDMSVYKDPGYKGTIGNTAANPLANRRAFVNQNASYPNTDLVYLNLGTTFAGKNIRIRFRVGTDQASGEEGWTIDNISFSGILNTPFGAIIADEAEGTPYYTDADGDGFGDPESETLYCVQPEASIADGTDCNDQSSAAFPGNAEYCDGIDNDCDSAIDEFAIDRQIFYADADGDGYGDSAVSQPACSKPEGYVSVNGDCNDQSASVSPAGKEVCDNIDNNCDGSVDNAPSDGTTYYADADGDGAGDTASAVVACVQPDGSVTVGGDCNDAESRSTPGKTEVCDGVDNDCEGTIDVGASDSQTYYFDLDQDGFGSAATVATACAAPAGYVSNAEDCDDNNQEINPEATEICDGIDNNCDTLVDEKSSATPRWYGDADGDGHGDVNFPEDACAAPTGYVSSSDDCDDGDASVYPGAEEPADGIDHNCDGISSTPSPTPTPSPVPTATPVDNPSPTPEVTPEATPTATPATTPAETPTATAAPEPTATPDEPTATPPDSTPPSSPEPSATPEVPVSGCSCDQKGSGSAPTTPAGLAILFLGSLLRLRRKAVR